MDKVSTGRGKVAYLVNKYPAPTHTFIRSEIRALESSGWRVYRFSHRECLAELVDDLDIEERGKTSVLLSAESCRQAVPVILYLMRRPRRTVEALLFALVLAYRGDRRFFAHCGYFAIACLLSKSLHDLGYPHVHAHFGTNSCTVALLVHRLCNVDFSFTAHSTYEYENPDEVNLDEKLEHAVFARLISRHGYDAVSARFPRHAPKLRLIPCGLESGWFDDAPTPIPDSHQLVCVARLAVHKDIPSLLEAASLLRDRGISFRLLLAGDGNRRAEVEKIIRDRGLQSTVVLAGWCNRSEIRKHLRRSIALVLSSRDEGIPVALMEAFAMGRPVVATDVGGVRELVETGKTGWLVPPRDPSALAEALSACLGEHPTALRALAAAGRRRVLDYDVASTAESLADEIGGRHAG